MPSATASTRGAEPSIPDFTATGGRASATASSWRVTSSTGTGSHARTPIVFWAVTAGGPPPPETPQLLERLKGGPVAGPPPPARPPPGGGGFSQRPVPPS